MADVHLTGIAPRFQTAPLTQRDQDRPSRSMV